MQNKSIKELMCFIKVLKALSHRTINISVSGATNHAHCICKHSLVQIIKTKS